MRILDQNDVELDREDIDLEKGRLEDDKLFIAHHEATEAVPEQSHYYLQTVYFTDGTSAHLEGEDDPHIEVVDADKGLFDYVFLEGETEKEIKGKDLGRIVDVEYQPAKEAYDEEEDIQRYIPYTEEELAQIKADREQAQKQENFISTGPDRLSNVEVGLDDMTLVMSEIIVAASESI